MCTQMSTGWPSSSSSGSGDFSDGTCPSSVGELMGLRFEEILDAVIRTDASIRSLRELPNLEKREIAERFLSERGDSFAQNFLKRVHVFTLFADSHGLMGDFENRDEVVPVLAVCTLQLVNLLNDTEDHWSMSREVAAFMAGLTTKPARPRPGTEYSRKKYVLVQRSLMVGGFAVFWLYWNSSRAIGPLRV